MQTISEITDPRQLESLREDWSRLLARTPGADFFRTLDWLQVYWDHFGDRQGLRVLVVSEAGRTTAIVPLAITPHRNRMGSFRVLTYPLDFWGSFYGPVADDPQASLRSALTYLKARRRDWDYVDLRWMELHECQRDWIAAELTSSGMPSQRRAVEQIPIVDMRSDWETYWSSRSGNWRSNCRRAEKKLSKKYDVEYLRHRPAAGGDPRWDLFEQCEAIAAKSWQGSSTSGTTITHDSVRDFIRDLHAAAARTGCLDLNLLMANGKAVAFNYNFHYRGRVSSLRLGFDPEYGRYGAGTVLTHRMLKDSFDLGDHTFDFLPGSLDAKRNWQTSVETCYAYQYLPRQWGRVELLRAKQWLGRQLGRLRSECSHWAKRLFTNKRNAQHGAAAAQMEKKHA